MSNALKIKKDAKILKMSSDKKKDTSDVQRRDKIHKDVSQEI